MRARVPMSDPPESSATPRCKWAAENSESVPRVASPYFRMRGVDRREAVGPIEAGLRSASQAEIAVLAEQPFCKASATESF